MITRPNEYNVKTTPSFICDQYAGDNHFFSLFQAFRFPEVKQQPIRSSLLESLSRGFAKLASFAKNTDMGWSRINYISALQENPTRCRISR
jgi:hypothetical protein